MTKLKGFQQRKKSVIAEEFQVHPSTVTAVLKNKEKYRADLQYLDSTSLKGESELDEGLPKDYAMYTIIVVRNVQSKQPGIHLKQKLSSAQNQLRIWEFGNCTLSATSLTASLSLIHI